jgi:hypothetical protein
LSLKKLFLSPGRKLQWDASTFTRRIYHPLYGEHFGDKNFSVILGALAKLRKTTISFIMLVHPSVCPHGTTLLPLDGFL